MLRIGITGGIGSGKSTVARMFSLLGVPVYFADDEAKKLMNENIEIKKQIINAFGMEAYVENQLNRQFISKIIFGDSEKLKSLNDIVHPAVIKHGENWMAGQTSNYILKEAALIFESNSYKQLDFVIGVWSPVELRISRVVQRDGSKREDVLAKMDKQMNEDEKMKRCDYIIINNEQVAVITQVLKLHSQFSNKNQLT
jgi:dephospho-CoA kinase